MGGGAGARNGAGVFVDHDQATPTGSGGAESGTSTLVGVAPGTGMGVELKRGAGVGRCGGTGRAGAGSKSGGVERGGERDGGLSALRLMLAAGIDDGAGISKVGARHWGVVAGTGSASGGGGRDGSRGSTNCGGVARIRAGGGTAPSSVTAVRAAGLVASPDSP
jgi:hypothetical protein